MTIEKGKPFFSVVIPVYNKEKYLAKTLDSVLNQKFNDFELLLVLDPSTDRSEDIARSFKDPRIRIFNRNIPGSGGYAARNKGVAESTADWIVFQDADDLWHDNHLELLASAVRFTANDARVICTSYLNESRGKRSPDQYHRKFAERGDHYFDFKEFLLYRPICSINVAVKKSEFIEAGEFPVNNVDRGGDHDTWLRIMNLVRKGYWIKEITAVYNKNVPDGVIKSTLPLTFDHVIYKTVRQMISEEQDPETIYALKRFSNSFVITGVKYRAKSGNLTASDLKALYPEAHLKKGQLIMFRLLTVLPGTLQRSLTKFYKSMR